MSKFFLDTGILLGIIRGSGYAEFIEKEYNLFNQTTFSYISVVTVGEIYSLAIQFGWGDKKIRILDDILKQIPVIDINSDEVIRRYAEVDAYSQCKHPTKQMSDNLSARNMGKNDLWIAATASVLNAKLLTTDRDFDHLESRFLEVIYIDKDTKK